MNTKVKIVPINVQSEPAKTVRLESIMWTTNDDPEKRQLSIYINRGAVKLIVKGDEYDALGQWTDPQLRDYIFTKLGLTAAPVDTQS